MLLLHLFDPKFRPDNLKVFFRPNFLSHDKRLLVKEKNTRTSREGPIARFFDPRAVILVVTVTDGHTLNLTTVTCLENPAEPGQTLDFLRREKEFEAQTFRIDSTHEYYKTTKFQLQTPSLSAPTGNPFFQNRTLFFAL